MSATLYINKSDSFCGECNRPVNPHLQQCPECGVTWTVLSSHYAGGGIERAVMRMRPDLEPDFPWSDFWETQEGQRTLEEFRVELQMDERQE